MLQRFPAEEVLLASKFIIPHQKKLDIGQSVC
jgi:hypothetical protein